MGGQRGKQGKSFLRAFAPKAKVFGFELAPLFPIADTKKIKTQHKKQVGG
jgi:hypothetical protein